MFLAESYLIVSRFINSHICVVISSWSRNILLISCFSFALHWEILFNTARNSFHQTSIIGSRTWVLIILRYFCGHTEGSSRRFWKNIFLLRLISSRFRIIIDLSLKSSILIKWIHWLWWFGTINLGWVATRTWVEGASSIGRADYCFSPSSSIEGWFLKLCHFNNGFAFFARGFISSIIIYN